MLQDNHKNKGRKALSTKASGRFSLRHISLIITLIALSTIGILTILAYPHFTNDSDAPHRRAAQSAMETLALALERDFTLNDAYTDLISEGVFTTTADLSKSYLLRVITENNGRDYTILATPIGPQTGDACGTLRLTSRGIRSGHKDNCWE